MSQHSGPVSDSERIVSLDVLRGFALLGILTMNIGSFSMPEAAYFDPTAYGDLTGLNGWIWRLTHMLGDLKFMAIFSMLFGAGIVLMSQRRQARGEPVTGLHYRRMAWLIVFGLLHGHLLWYGDILYWYGMCGLVVYWFRNLTPAWLITYGLLLISVASALMLGAGLSVEAWPPDALEFVVADLKPSAAVIAAEVEAYRGGWLEQLSHRRPKALDMEGATFLAWAFWRAGGLMLLGMGLFKLNVFNATRSPKFYRTLIAIAIVVGLPVIAFGIRRQFATGWPAPEFFFLGHQFNYWASILVALGWIGVVMLLCQSDVLSGLKRRLAAVGQMAFSNYILQTVLCTSIFYGFGLGLFGQVDRTGQAMIVVAVWAFQLVASALWLERFRFGPLEWLWRSLVYLAPQPLRRGEPVSAASH